MSQPSPKPSLSVAPCALLAEENARWFEQEVYTHGGQLRSYLRGSFPSVRDVDDVIQESYLRVWKAKATDSILSAKAFLFQVARNVATDIIRRAQASPIQGVTDLGVLSVLDSKPDAAESACTREEIALLADAIDTLPRRCREIFILRKLIRVPQKEIAATLGLSEQTVQVQVLRGMKRCEHYLARRGL
ncbi:MAG: polymerase, sigma-24 subunit, subfamily [Verrucomicrobia bacterium]|nr:polymerase, sigma-24 subunit, subfamily [Verrucomicrobiota bacterium]